MVIYVKCTCMYKGMFFHVRLLVKSFSTVWARKGSCVAVDEKMGRKSRRSLEGFVAYVTLENLTKNVYFR